MRKNRKTLFTLSGIVVTLASSLAICFSTLSWFNSQQTLDGLEDLGGSVLRNYFHSGKGTAEEPFTITTPWHYENFVKLHYRVDGFAEQGFFFEFGYKFDGVNPTFYKTDSQGKVDYSDNTSTVLNLGNADLVPLGTEEQPFFGQVEGHGLTVKNFTVNGKGFNDVGIFGYVCSVVKEDGTTQNAKVSNCYWSDFTISTTESSSEAFPHVREESKHDDDVAAGYLAGHIIDSSNFTNCYVNNCRLQGATPSSTVSNAYGYYGKVELDAAGGGTGKGHNYQFNLDAGTVFDSLNANYRNFEDNPIRTRVDENGKHYAEYNPPAMTGIDPSNPQDEFVNDVAKYPVGNSISRDGNYTFDLNGKTVNDKNAEYSYSLSSLGYQPFANGVKQQEYDITYSHGGSEHIPAYNATQNNDAPGLDGTSTAGDTIRYDTTTSSWIYQHSENDNTTYVAAKDMTFNLKIGINSFNLAAVGGGAPSMAGCWLYFYLDGKQIFTCNPTCNIRRYWEGLSYRYEISNIKIPDDKQSFTYPMQRGLHYYAYFIAFKTENNAMRYAYLCDNGTTVSLRSSNAKYYTVTQGQLNLDVDTYNRGYFNDFTATKYDGSNCAVTDGPDITVDSNAWNGVVPQYINPNSYEEKIIGTNVDTGTKSNLSDKTLTYERIDEDTPIEGILDGELINGEFYVGNIKVTPEEGKIYRQAITNDDGEIIDIIAYSYNGSSFVTNNIHDGYYRNNKFYTINTDGVLSGEISPIDGHYYHDLISGNTYYRYIASIEKYQDVNYESTYRWIAHDNPLRQVDYNASPVYLADDQALIDDGYDYQNIDIVGGGVSFTHYTNRLFGIDMKIINLQPETAGNYTVNSITADDLGKPFYATKYCPGSVVMSIKNFCNAADDADHLLGDIKFRYANMEIGGRSFINLERPSFKKGSGVFVNIDQFGRASPNQPLLSFQTQFECDITESGAKTASYCALDKNGNIIGKFDQNGNPGIGFVDSQGNVLVSKLLEIDTYVVVLGASSRLSSALPTWVTSVQFSYVATNGYGGTFGPVGYRDAPDTLDTTVLNFNLVIPANATYSISVSFEKQEQGSQYQGIYTITFSANTTVQINIFNYFTDLYLIYFNGTPYPAEINTINYTP